MKRIIVHAERCYGCMTCEAACVTAHQIPGQRVTTETIMAAVNAHSMRTTRLWVGADPVTHEPLPVTCRHCTEPACASVCSVASLQVVGANAAVINDQGKCAGCWMCVMSCPFGAIDKFGKIALKCDLCPDRDTPACVTACPNEALEYVEVEELTEALYAGGGS